MKVKWIFPALVLLGSLMLQGCLTVVIEDFCLSGLGLPHIPCGD